MGKLYEDSLLDMNDCAHTFDYYAGLAVEQHGQTLEVPGESLTWWCASRSASCAGITPWNFPILMAAWKLAPSLAAGNVMILKPASVTPLTSLSWPDLQEAGVPEGVFKVVTGPGGAVGDYLATSRRSARSPSPAAVEVGKHIMRRGAENVKKVGLELGGKSPNIVFADADFEAAIDGALIAIFAGSGEVCSAGSRLLVQRSIHDQFVGELVSRAMAHQDRPGTRTGQRDGSAGLARSSSTRSRSTSDRPSRRAPRCVTGGHRLDGAGLLLRADDLRRRRQQDADRPGGDLRPGARR